MADITYCANYLCENKECQRNACHLQDALPHSFCAFPECEHYKAYLKALEKEYEDEARREAMRLDDFEDTYKYRGWC